MPPAEVDNHALQEEAHEADRLTSVGPIGRESSVDRSNGKDAVRLVVEPDRRPRAAAAELGVEVADADAITRSGLQLLRAALDDLDASGRPL